MPGPTSPATQVAGAPASAAPAQATLPGGRVATPDEPLFPSPPPGAFVLAREAGARALAIAVKPGLVRVSVLAPAGGGQSGLDVSVRFGSGYLHDADPCGDGCYQTQFRGLPDSPITVAVGPDSYRFALPKLPAADGSAIVARATATWNALRTLVWRERLASSSTNVLHTIYRAEAPGSLAYAIAGGSAAVIIGGSRWDRSAPGAPWSRSIQDPPVRQPQPFWDGAADARVLGVAKVGTHRAWRVSFFDPSTPAWFEAWVDKLSGRTLRLEMIAASHFMHDVYGPFDAPVHLVPPT